MCSSMSCLDKPRRNPMNEESFFRYCPLMGEVKLESRIVSRNSELRFRGWSTETAGRREASKGGHYWMEMNPRRRICYECVALLMYKAKKSLKLLQRLKSRK